MNRDTRDEDLDENDDGSVDVDLPDDTADIMEMPDGSAVVTMETVGPEESRDFYANMAETMETYELDRLAMRYIDLLEKDKNAREDRDKQYEEGIRRTGLGKDAPGSPLSDAAIFPDHGLAWDFNYRGNLVFLDQARRQAGARHITIEDGWVYFIHGWTRVIAEVFAVDIPVSGSLFDEISQIAREAR